jgi:ketosteroid isomerase-like protein
MSSIPSKLETARSYLRAIAAGSPEDFAAFCTEDVEFVEAPNRMTPSGARRDLEAARQGAHRGRALMSAQTYEVVGAIAERDHVALEVEWTGTLAVAMQHLPVGYVMCCQIAMFLEFRDGKICRQRNYDCYLPF